MSWSFTDDPELFAREVLPLLLAEPELNTSALSILDTVRAGQRWSAEPITLGWYRTGGEVSGVVLRTPPFGFLLAALPVGSERALMTALIDRGAQVPEVNGALDVVDRFVAGWTALTGVRAREVQRQRLFRLDQLIPPATMPAGRARRAEFDDLELILDWMSGFHAESERTVVAPQPEIYRRRIGLGLISLWLDEQDNPVSMAGRNVTIAGVSRIGPVFTPVEHRRHGYAEAVTWAVSSDALNREAERLLLFTDLANPTSNAIYTRLGYRPVRDSAIVRFLE